MISFGENNFTPGRENCELNFWTPNLVHHYMSYSLQFMLICPEFLTMGWYLGQSMIGVPKRTFSFHI
jgi:hypothetical protein